MKIEVEQRDQYAIVRVEGRIVRENQAELRTQLEEQLAAGVRDIALDLENVDYMDSAALGCCASVRKLMQEKEKGPGSLVVFGASANIQRMWKLIRLHLVIPLLSDEAEAVAHLTKGAADSET